MEYTFFLIS